MARVPHHQAVFFELDGVLLRDVKQRPDGTLNYYTNALQALSRVDSRQFLLFVASNRADIAFGELRDRDFAKLCDRLHDDARALGFEISKIYFCPFHPRGKPKFRKESVFRKPAPGIFKMAQQEFELNLARSWMIGHTTTDILAASRAGMGTILVETGEGGKDGGYLVEPHFVEPDLRHAVARLMSFEHALKS